MEEKLNFLNKIRINYSTLLVEIGIQYLEEHPDNNPTEFIATYFPPHRIVHKILKEKFNENQRNQKSSELIMALNQKLEKIEAQLRNEVEIELIDDKLLDTIKIKSVNTTCKCIRHP